MQVIKTDSISAMGLRTISEGDTALLQGFDFNNDAKLGATILAPYSATIDRVTGATHFKLVSMPAEIDFAIGATVADGQDSAPLALSAAPTAVITLASALTANSTHSLFLVLGIQFTRR